MKTLVLAAPLLVLMPLATGVRAQDAAAADNPPPAAFVTCGPDTVAVMERSKSPDGHYALGWTIHPHPGKPAVNWSNFQSVSPYDWLVNYELDDEGYKGDYALIDGILDLRARQFIPFKSDLPYFPGKNHAGMDIAWSGVQHGSRFAVVNNDGRFYTAELWLIEANATGVHVTDIAPAAYRITRPYLRKHAAKHYDGLSVLFTANDTDKDGKPFSDTFTDGKLRLHFDAEVPKSTDDDGCTGVLTFALPSGKTLGISNR